MAITFKSVLAAVRARLQTKTVYPGLVDKTYYPDAGYDGFESFTVRLVEQDFINNRATPTESEQTVRPSSGFFSEFIVEPIPSQYKVPVSIAPSNSAPASMSSGTAYEPTTAGYAIQSYSSITPSSSGTAFSAGMNKMSASGYAYTSRPSASLKYELLWSNPNAGTSFAGQQITLSQSMEWYTYLCVEYNVKTSTTEAIRDYILRWDFQACMGDDAGRWAIGALIGSTLYTRTMRWDSNTQINISNAYKNSTSSHGTSTAYLIPTRIYGCYVSV